MTEKGERDDRERRREDDRGEERGMIEKRREG